MGLISLSEERKQQGNWKLLRENIIGNCTDVIYQKADCILKVSN